MAFAQNDGGPDGGSRTLVWALKYKNCAGLSLSCVFGYAFETISTSRLSRNLVAVADLLLSLTRCC